MDPPEPLESKHVSLVGYHDLDRRPGFKIAMQTVGDRWYLYLGHLWHSGWSVLDVTDPGAPELVRFIEGPANTITTQIQVADGLLVTSLEGTNWERGPIGGPTVKPEEPHEAGVAFWDVASDPTSPRRIGTFETGHIDDPNKRDGTHRNHYDGGDIAYIAAYYPEVQDKCLGIIDVSDPTDPTEVGRWWLDEQAPPESAPEYKRYYHGPAYPVDDLAFLSYGPEGMIVLDIADPENPEYVSQVQFGDQGSFINTHSAIPVPGSDHVIVNSECNNQHSPLEDEGEPRPFVYVVDVSRVEEGDPRWDNVDHYGPRIVSSFPSPRPAAFLPYRTYYEKPGRFGPHNQHHYQYQPEHAELRGVWPMTWFNAGLRLFDISEPLDVREVGHYVPEAPETPVNDVRPAEPTAHFEDVLVDRRGLIYCTDANYGLFVLESPLVDP